MTHWNLFSGLNRLGEDVDVFGLQPYQQQVQRNVETVDAHYVP